MDWQVIPTEIAKVRECLSARSGQVQGSTRAEQRRLASRPAGVEHRLGRQAKPPLGRVAAEARLPESRGPARSMSAADIFGFDDHHSKPPRETRGEAGTRDTATDNQDIDFMHLFAGYGLERRGV